jgi:hypothetical protein
MRMLVEKAGQIFQMGEPAGNGERTTDHFSDGLLHGLDLRVHQGILNSVTGWWSNSKSRPRGCERMITTFEAYQDLPPLRAPSSILQMRLQAASWETENV